MITAEIVGRERTAAGKAIFLKSLKDATREQEELLAKAKNPNV